MKNLKITILVILASIAYIEALPSKILVTSIPKSGTFLLAKLVESLTGLSAYGTVSILKSEDANPKPGTFLLSHAPAVEKNIKLIRENKFKTIVLIRDPRDVIVSMYYYFGKRHAAKCGLDYELDRDKLIMLYITKWYTTPNPDIPTGFYLKGDYQAFLDWRKFPNVHFTTYEALVGGKGGGNDEIQKKEIHALANFLTITLADDELIMLADSLYGDTATFRSGRIGSWKDHFTPEHVQAFKKYAGDLLIKLGYEKDYNWGSSLFR